MDTCWICGCDLKNDSILLPHSDDFFHGSLPLFKNTFIIKKIDTFEFLYYTCCADCMNNYLRKKNYIFRYLQKRELGMNI